MAVQDFSEGVRPGGLTSGKEVQILLCYLLSALNAPVSKEQLEQVLLEEALVNYFSMAESLAALEEQELITLSDGVYTITEKGCTVGRTLADDVPRTVRDTAVRGLIRAQQYAAKKAEHRCEVVQTQDGQIAVHCSIGDDACSPLFQMQLYMPDALCANAAREAFIEHGSEVYKLMLAALTVNEGMARDALRELLKPEP